MDEDGFVWYTAYGGRSIGRLDPATGDILEFPLPDTISNAPPTVFVGPGPWEILQAPNGDILFHEFFDATITRFDRSRVSDPACLQLNAQGANPCMQDWVVPEMNLEKEQVHSITYDRKGNLWFGIHTDNEPGLGGSVGFIAGDGRYIVRLPDLSLFTGTDAAAAAGMATEPITGDIWFCEFWRKRIGRLRRIPEF